MNDIFYKKGNWYFWDETGLDQGPFTSAILAEAALDIYIKYELQDRKEPIRKMKDNMGV